MEMNETIEIQNVSLKNDLNHIEDCIITDPIPINNENYISMQTNLENILKSFECIELFKAFKTFQSLILDENLQFFNLNNFLNLFKTNKGQIIKSHLNQHMDYISSAINSGSTKSDSHYMDLYCNIEINYLIILAFFKINNFKYSISRSSHNSLDESSVMNDFINLSNLKISYENFFESFINFAYEFSLKVRLKEYFILFIQIDKKCSEIFKYKIVISNLELILNPIFMSLRYILSPTDSILEEDLKIDIQKFGSVTKTLFKVIFDYMIIYYKSFEATILSKISNFNSFEAYMIFQTIITNYISEIKFKEKDNLIDYNTFFPNFSEWFWVDFISIYKQKILTKIEEYVYVILHIDKFNLKKLDQFYFAPYLLHRSNEAFKDFIMNHLMASYLNDNNYEVVSRNLWLKNTIECFCLSNFLESLFRILTEYFQGRENNLINDNSIIVLIILKRLENIFENVNLILPKKMMLFRDIYTITYLLILHHFILKFPSITLSQNLVYALQDFSLYQNRNYFLICNHILELKNISNQSKFRIYGGHLLPLDYQEISSMTNSNKKLKEINKDEISNTIIKTQSNNLNYARSSDLENLNDDVIIDLENQMLTEENNENLNLINITNSQINILHHHNLEPIRKNSKSKKKIISSSNNHPKRQNSKTKFQSTKKIRKNSKSKSYKNNSSPSFIKFDVTALMTTFEKEQINSLQKKNGKLMKFTKNKNGKNILKIRDDLTPCYLIQNENMIDIIFNHLNTSNLKEKLFKCSEVINRNDLEYMMIMNLDILNQNVDIHSENLENSIRNYSNIFKHYDIEEKLDYYEIVENLLRIFD